MVLKGMPDSRVGAATETHRGPLAFDPRQPRRVFDDDSLTWIKGAACHVHDHRAHKETSMSLKRVRLELARTKEFPEGSSRHGYEFVAPLDGDGYLDPDSWPTSKSACTVRRFWNRDADEHGMLIHRRNGSWAFSYKPGDEDDEAIFKFDRHAFVPGEYVTVTEHDGVARPFRVVSVRV
jgi:hypothetical protein